MNLKSFKKLFKRRHPYAPAAFIGRKTVERILGADIVKLKTIEKAKVKDREENRRKSAEF